MVAPKQQSKPKKQKPKKGGVDFKKYKHKVGRKLPPPKSATDTTIHSKVIVLPEQSVAVERTGVVVGNRGLTLRELLAQTTHHNVKVRRAALAGIKDLLLKNPLELKLHKVPIIEKLRERVLDSDKVVRDMLYDMLKLVVFPSLREDITVNIINMLMAFIGNAMTNLSMDIRFMAFNFLELLVLNYPSAFVAHSDMIIDNYIVVLKDTKVYLCKGKTLESIFHGLENCLALLDSKTQRNSVRGPLNETVVNGLLRSFDSSYTRNNSGEGFLSVVKKLNDFVPVLIQYVEDSFSLICANRDINAQSFESLLSAMNCINLTTRLFVDEKQRTQRRYIISETSTCNFCLLQNLQKLWNSFTSKAQRLLEKEYDKIVILKVRVVEVILNLMDWQSIYAFIEGELLEFIVDLLEKATEHESQKILEKLLPPLLTAIPAIIAADISRSSIERLLTAFTNSFEACSANSRLIPIYLSVIENMLFSDYSGSLILKERKQWIFKVFRLLESSDKYPAIAKAVLELLLNVGRFSFPVGDDELVLFVDFFCKIVNGNKCFGPFGKLPRDGKELAICCLYYYIGSYHDFPNMVANCCAKLEPDLCLRVAEVLQSAFRAGKLKLEEQLAFLFTLVAHYPGKLHSPENDGTSSNWKTFFNIFSQMGDGPLLLKLIWGIMSSEIKKMNRSQEEQESSKPFLTTMNGFLRLLVALDARTTKISEEEIIELSEWVRSYIIKASSVYNDSMDECRMNVPSDKMRMFQYHMKPCMVLFRRNASVTSHTIVLLTSFSSGEDPSSTDPLDIRCSLSRRVRIVLSTLKFIYNDSELNKNLAGNASTVKTALGNIENILVSSASDFTHDDKCGIRNAIDQLRLRLIA